MPLSRAEYEALNAVNWSSLRLLEKSPKHFKLGWGDDESSSMRLGTAGHAAILEPEKFARDFVVYPGKVRRGKEWEAFEAAAINNGQTVVSRSEHADAISMRDAVFANVRAAAYLTGGEAEVAVTWTIRGAEFSFNCKGRQDYISDAIVDVKSTRDASPRGFANSCRKYGYYGQAAFYSDGLFLATGKRKPFVFIAVESSAPWIVQVYRVPPHVLEHGREQYLSLLGKLDYCTKHDAWGGYSDAEELDLEISHWRNND